MNGIIRRAVKALRGMSWACSRGDHMNCPGMSCTCSCH